MIEESTLERKRRQRRESYRRHASKYLKQKVEKRLANPEGYKSKWRAYNKKRSEWRAAYRKTHRERDRERARAYIQTPIGRAKLQAKNADYRKARPEYVHKLWKLWVERNPKAWAHHQAKRAAVVRGASGSHTLKEWNELCTRYSHRCAYCGADRPLTRDHYLPITRGGTHDIENILPACRKCNSSKGNRIYGAALSEWIELRRNKPSKGNQNEENQA